MSYMNCPRCRFSIRLRASYLTLERCPRCLARRQVVVQMYISDRPGGAQIAEEPRAADERRQRSEDRGPTEESQPMGRDEFTLSTQRPLAGLVQPASGLEGRRFGSRRPGPTDAR